MWCDDPDLLAWEVRTGWGKLLGGIKEKYVNKSQSKLFVCKIMYLSGF